MIILYATFLIMEGLRRLVKQQFSDIFLAMMVGGLFLAAIVAPLTYLFTRRYLFRLRRRAYSRRKIVNLK